MKAFRIQHASEVVKEVIAKLEQRHDAAHKLVDDYLTGVLAKALQVQ
jgi:hypothetical protein